VALVDRTCLGVKDAFLGDFVDDDELGLFLRSLGAPHGGMQAQEPLVVQSVVFHALDYARRLGFSPHPEFIEALFGPRPESMLATPWYAAQRPIFIAGPHDDADRVRAQLIAVVGEGHFDLLEHAELLELAEGGMAQDTSLPDPSPEGSKSGKSERKPVSR
jgi:hypothetical protein